jgi:hypothetical protein
MSPDRLSMLQERKHRTVSQTSQLSKMSEASEATSEFLEEKVKEYQSQLDYFTTYKEGLQESYDAQRLSKGEFDKERDSINDDFNEISHVLRCLKRSQRVIKEDFDDEVQKGKRLRPNTLQPDIGLLERAYASTIVSRVMAASARPGKQREFDQRAFRKRVLSYYKAIDESLHCAYCHLLGWWFDKSCVKAAHLVPKSLSDEEVSSLFGGVEVLSEARNGMY